MRSRRSVHTRGFQEGDTHYEGLTDRASGQVEMQEESS
jgi:hypothetical protein